MKLALNVFDLTEEQKDERVDYVLEALGMSRYKKKRISQPVDSSREFPLQEHL